MKRFVSICIAVAFGLAVSSAAAKPVQATANGQTATLRQGHPRLILTKERLVELKSMYRSDTLLQRYVRQTLDKADSILMNDTVRLTRDIGKRDMLHISRHAVERIYFLSFAWRWTGKKEYASAALDNLLTVCDFTDWHPGHFLDVAEMTNAVAIGYDWLYGWLDPESRELIRRAIIGKGLEPGMNVYNSESGFHKRPNNWNQVCNNSMIIGALAVGDTEPDLFRSIIQNAVTSMPIAMEAFDPEGVCVEGPGYWHYALRYCAYGFESMNTALGTDFGLSSQYNGFSLTGYFPIVTTGPTQLMLSYSDCSMKTRRTPLPPMLWLSRRFSNPDFSEAEHDVLRHYPAQVFHILYYTPRKAGWQASAPRDRYLRSIVEVACLRSGWDENALFVGMKGGTTEVSHVQLDMGNFEMDALGERWILDLGADFYSLPGYFDFRNQRWDYYRNVTRSHNLPVFNGKEQSLKSSVRFVGMALDNDEPWVVMDLDSAYRNQARHMWRGIKLVSGRRAMVVQDEFALPSPGNVNWGVMTDAEVQVEGNRAFFTLRGKRMTATILSPMDAVFRLAPAEQGAQEKSNQGISRLSIDLSGKTFGTVSVLFAPHWEVGPATYGQVILLDDWVR